MIDKSLTNSTNSFINLLYFLHMRVIWFKCCKKYMRKSNQETFNYFGRIYGLTSQYRFYARKLVMHWIFYTFFVKFVVETFFFNKVHFSEVLWLLEWVLFSGKDYYVLLLVLLILNKYIEIYTLIKRNLNFKCKVKSHKIHLQAYCNNKMLTILFENKADNEHLTDIWCYLLIDYCNSGGKIITRNLTLIWVGSLGVRFEVGRGGKLPPV